MKLEYGVAPRDEFIAASIPLVWSIAHRFSRRAYALRLEMEDVFGYGCIGLVKAYNRFNPTLGYAWSTYAVPYITGEIKRAFRDHVRPITESRHVIALVDKIGNSVESPDEIADRFSVDVNTARRALQYRDMSCVSLEIPTSDDGSVLGDLLPSGDDPAEASLLAVSVDELPDRYRKVALLRLKGLTQKQIAEHCGCGQVYVSRMLAKIKKYYQREEMMA